MWAISLKLQLELHHQRHISAWKGQPSCEDTVLCLSATLDCTHLTTHNNDVVSNSSDSLARILKTRRTLIALTIRELAAQSGVTTSHLSRIEKGNRFPSAHVLRKIAKPLGFEENELFMLAGFLSPRSRTTAEDSPTYVYEWLDPHVVKILSQEPVETQRVVVGIMSILKSIAKSLKKE